MNAYTYEGMPNAYRIRAIEGPAIVDHPLEVCTENILQAGRIARHSTHSKYTATVER